MSRGTIDIHFDFDAKAYYRSLHLNRNIIFLYANRLLIQIAVGMLSVFTAVFFFEQFNSFTATMLVFVALYFFGVLLAPLSAMLLSKMGMKKMLIIAVSFMPLANIALALWGKNPALSLISFVVFMVLYRTLYWAPYHIDFAKFTDKKDRGKQMSLLLNLSEVLLTLTPIIAGIVIAAYGFAHLFWIATVATLLAVVPLLFIEDTHEQYTFGYTETFKKLFEEKNRSLSIAYFGDGIQTAVRIAIWPIFIYGLLEGKYVSIGIVTSLTIFLLIAARFVLGNLEDRVDRKKLLKFGSFFSTTGWLFKIFVENGFQIFVADTYHKMGRMVNRLTFDVATYDQAADNGHYIDEFTVLKEVSLNAGRCFIVLVAIWLASAFGIVATFVFAAIATLMMTFLNKDVYIQ